MTETSVAKPADEAPAAAVNRAIRIQEYALVFVIAALIAIGAMVGGDRFLSVGNLFTILTNASVVGVLAVGMTYVIATGGIDLSVGSIVAAASIAGGLIVRNEMVGDSAMSIG